MTQESNQKIGIPGGTRTPTNGFGDRSAAITPPRNFIVLIYLNYSVRLLYIVFCAVLSATIYPGPNNWIT